MKKIMIVTLVVVLVGLGGLLLMYTPTVSPENVIVLESNVSDRAITLKGDFAASAVNFRGYTTDYKDEVLSIKLNGSIVNFPKKSGRFDISIENKFGNIKQVFLQGNDKENNRLIWPQK